MRVYSHIDLVADESNPSAVEKRDILAVEMLRREVRIISSRKRENIELVVVLGGDGTILKTAHTYDFKPAFLGINCGHKGFLMNEAGPEDAAERILNMEFKIHEFPLLRIESEDGWTSLATDVYFNRIAGQTCKVNVRVNGVELAERITGDGIVICTALGSGGYFVPAGGSAIHPKAEVLGFASVVGHTRLPAMIYPLDTVFEVRLLSPPDEARGWHDGIDLPVNFRKLIIRKSDRVIRLAFWKEEEFTRRMVGKIMRGYGGGK